MPYNETPTKGKTMTKNEPIVEIVDPETASVIARVKTKTKTIKPLYVAIAAATAVAGVVGGLYVYGQAKNPDLMDELKETISDNG